MTIEQLHWLAGYLEGEGCFYIQKRRGRPMTISICVGATDEDVVRKAAALLGSRVLGPYFYQKKQKKPTWQATVCSSKAAEIMLLIRPYMGERRGKKIDEILEFFATLSPQAHSQK